MNEKKFKLLFLDVGLLQSALEIDPVVFGTISFHQVNSGELAAIRRTRMARLWRLLRRTFSILLGN